MIQLNLLPDIKREFLRAQRVKRLFILVAFLVSASSVAIVVVMALFVFGVQGRHADNLKKDIESGISTLQATDNLDRILTVQNQLESLPGLHEDKPYVSRLFSYLTVIIPNEVSLDDLSVIFDQDGSNGTIEIKGRSNDFKQVNVLVDSMKNAIYQSASTTGQNNAFPVVTLDSINKSDDETLFTVIAEFDPTIFAASENQIRLNVPNITSSPSVTERPTELFNEVPATNEEGGN